MRSLLIILTTALAVSTGCSSLRKPPPMGAVPEAPANLRAMRIHVHNATSQAAVADGEDSVTGYTLMVRGAVQEALVKAGYVVVVDEHAPRDVVAVVHTDYQTRDPVGGELVTSMTLWTPAGDAVIQLAGAIEVDKHSHIQPDDAVKLVNALGQNPRTQAYAKKLNEQVPDVPCREQKVHRQQSHGRPFATHSGGGSTGALARPRR